MIEVIPFTILGGGFLLCLLSANKEVDEVFRRLFFFLALLTLPVSMGACVHIAVEEGSTGLESFSTGALIAYSGVFTLLLAVFLFEFLSGKLEEL